MTTIAAIVRDGVAYMAGDRCQTIYTCNRLTSGQPKIYTHGGWLWGSAGNSDAPALLADHFDGQMLAERYDVEQLQRQLGIFLERNWPEAKATPEGYATFLFAHPMHGVWLLGGTQRMLGKIDEWSGFAIGLGSEPARGALWMAARANVLPGEALRVALEAAAHIVEGTGGPFDFLTEAKPTA